MLKKILLFITFLAVSQAQVPCENYWKYIRGGTGEGVQGLVTIHPSNSAEHRFKILLSVASKLPSVSIQKNITT